MSGEKTRSAKGRLSRRAVMLGALGVGGAAAWAGLSAKASSAEERYPPLGEFETVDGVRLHVLDRGPRDAVPVVLLHGASGNLRDFGFGFSEGLLDRYRVIAVDRPGLGHSERGPDDADRPDVQAKLIREALKRRGVDRAIVLGHSLGGAPALAWALDAPDSVIAVVSVAGGVMPWPGGVDFLYDAASTPVIGRLASNLISAFISEDYLKARIGGIFAPQSPPEGYLDEIGAALAARPATLRHNARDIASLSDFLAEQSKRYPSLTRPVEVVHGLADTIVPAERHAEGLARLTKMARLDLLLGVGHMPHHAARAAVYAAIDRAAASA